MSSRYGTTKSTHEPFGTADNSPGSENHMKGGVSAVPALGPRKFLTRRSSLWLLPVPTHTSTVSTGTHNGAANLPDNKKIKQMQY